MPPLIKLAEALYVLLFAHGLTTVFGQSMPPPAPLDTDLRLIWRSPQTKYELYSEEHTSMLILRYLLPSPLDRHAMVAIIVYLSIYSNKENSNPFLYLVCNKIWKNLGVTMHSFLFLIFDSTYQDEYLEVQRANNT